MTARIGHFQSKPCSAVFISHTLELVLVLDTVEGHRAKQFT
jgi:hypothetical protein